VKIGRQFRLLCPWARHLTGLPLPKGVGRKISREGPTEKRLKNSNRPEASSGGGQQRKKTENRTIKPHICTMYENTGSTAPLPPAADAHASAYEWLDC